MTVRPASLRDPDAELFLADSRVFRHVHAHAAAAFEEIQQRRSVRDLVARGAIVATRKTNSGELPDVIAGLGAGIYEHERIPFISVPSEWSPAMLAHAGQFTIELARELLCDGLLLKDATPANIQYRGPAPCLVDVPSIVPRASGSFIWEAQQQYLSCFLLPLIASLEAGVPIAWSLQDTFSGVTFESVARVLGIRRWLKPSILRSVAIPAALAGASSSRMHNARRRTLTNDKQARFILDRGLTGLLRQAVTLKRRVGERGSHWQDYTGARSHYAEPDLVAKREFVLGAIDQTQPKWTLDVGANTGEFSEIASRFGNVVAVDSDEASVSRMFERAAQKGLPVLPLVVDLAKPTPARGWCNEESQSFLSRAHKRFDMLLMLAVIHHLRVSAGIPLQRIVDLMAELTVGHLVLEFVPPSDPMFLEIARGREGIYQDYTADNLERMLESRFKIAQSLRLGNGRTLFLASLVSCPVCNFP